MSQEIANGVEDDVDGDGEGAELDTTGVLAERLGQLREDAWLAPVLERALAEMTGKRAAVAGARVEYCKIKPNRDINVALVARVRGDAGEREHRLSCTLYASAEACREKLAAECAPGAPAASVRRRLAEDGVLRGVVGLDEPAMIVRAFPLDPALPGLAHATDPEEMGARLGGRVVRCEVLHYKPRRSCAIHYVVEPERGIGGNGGAHAPRRYYGKLSRDDRGLRYHRNLRAAHDAAAASGGLWRAARPVGYVAEWRLLLQEAVLGRDFRVVFGELTPDDMSAAQRARVTKLLADIARAVRALQDAPPVEGPRMDFAHLYESQERNLAYMRRLEPELASDLAAVRADTLRLEPRTRANALVLSHGDFAHGNVLIETDGGADRVGIIDFDKAGSAEPAYDPAYFLTHMWSFGIRHPRRAPHVAELCAHFRSAYLALAPEVSPRRLALLEALDFSAYVLRNFRKQSHQSQWLAWARAQVAAARERLRVAAGEPPA